MKAKPIVSKLKEKNVFSYSIQTEYDTNKILTAVGTKMAVFWIVQPCRL